MTMQKSDIGSQPAFPQSVCPMLVRDGYDHATNCEWCHGTGLVGGGLTKREWLIGQIAVGYATRADGFLGDPKAAKIVAQRVDELLARMESADAK